jgi:hypothetical protein
MKSAASENILDKEKAAAITYYGFLRRVFL